MKAAVWDIYTKWTDGNMIYIQIIVPVRVKNRRTVLDLIRAYLTIDLQDKKLHEVECRFVHIFSPSDIISKGVEEHGYVIAYQENIPVTIAENSSALEVETYLKAHFSVLRSTNMRGMGVQSIRQLVKLANRVD